MSAPNDSASPAASAPGGDVTITLPDGSKRSFDAPVTGAQLAADIGPGLAKAALAIRLDGEVRDLSWLIDRDAEVSIITRKDEDALELVRHDAAHVMAQAVQELYPGTQVTIGPAIENGFYYDFSRDEPFTPDDLEKIEARMRDIIAADEPFVREVWDRDEAVREFTDMGDRRPSPRRRCLRLPSGQMVRSLPWPASALDRPCR